MDALHTLFQQEIDKMVNERFTNEKRALAAEREELKREKQRLAIDAKKSSVQPSPEACVTLNVGGTLYTTLRATLTKREPDSMLAVMFSGRHSLLTDQNGNYFIDTDGNIFRYILEYLRYGSISVVDLSENEKFKLLRDAEFFLLKGLVAILKPETPDISSVFKQNGCFMSHKEREKVDVICFVGKTLIRIFCVSGLEVEKIGTHNYITPDHLISPNSTGDQLTFFHLNDTPEPRTYYFFESRQPLTERLHKQKASDKCALMFHTTLTTFTYIFSDGVSVQGSLEPISQNPQGIWNTVGTYMESTEPRKVKFMFFEGFVAVYDLNMSSFYKIFWIRN